MTKFNPKNSYDIRRVLSRLEALRSTGTGRWSARCPAHADRNPSLTIREGERGLLLRCWGGCTLEDLCSALGLTVRDLFYDSSPDPGAWQSARRGRRKPHCEERRPRLGLWRQIASNYENLALSYRLRAERVLSLARGLDISQWTDGQVEKALNAINRAYWDLGRADELEAVAFTLRTRGLAQEGKL